MAYAEHAVVPELKAWVDCFWSFHVAEDAGPLEHWVPPDGGLSLSFHRRAGRLSLAGPHLEPFRPPVVAGMVLWGVRFWPGAGQALLGLAPRAIRDRFVDAAEVLDGGILDSLVAALRASPDAESAVGELEAWLGARAAAPGRALDEAVMSAVLQLVASCGQKRISEIAAAVALSPRQLRRRFGAFVGLTAKELARIRRFRASAIGAVEQGQAWAWLASEYGYTDQSHLSREFQQLIGLSPKAFAEQFAKIQHRLRSG